MLLHVSVCDLHQGTPRNDKDYCPGSFVDKNSFEFPKQNEGLLCFVLSVACSRLE